MLTEQRQCNPLGRNYICKIKRLVCTAMVHTWPTMLCDALDPIILILSLEVFSLKHLRMIKSS